MRGVKNAGVADDLTQTPLAHRQEAQTCSLLGSSGKTCHCGSPGTEAGYWKI